jgi:hypothetical protein
LVIFTPAPNLRAIVPSDPGSTIRTHFFRAVARFCRRETGEYMVKRVRQKIETRPHDPDVIVTSRGLGYTFLDTDGKD